VHDRVGEERLELAVVPPAIFAGRDGREHDRAGVGEAALAAGNLGERTVDRRAVDDARGVGGKRRDLAGAVHEDHQRMKRAGNTVVSR